jgi:alkylhydroperoxidase/carboxymuconolactone decarboxylase family protein YurZ
VHAPADSTHRYFVNAIRDAFLGMTTHLRRMPTPAWYELSRARHRRQAWGSNLLLHLSEAANAGVSREELMKVPELITAFINARLAEQPHTVISDALEDRSRRAA